MYEDILVARYIIAALLVILLSMAGCAQVCTTTASYKVSTDGTKEISYSSCKEQIGLDAQFKDGTPERVRVDKASPDNANALILESNKLLLEAIRTGIELGKNIK